MSGSKNKIGVFATLLVLNDLTALEVIKVTYEVTEWFLAIVGPVGDEVDIQIIIMIFSHKKTDY